MALASSLARLVPFAATLLFGAGAHADVLVDRSPDAVGVPSRNHLASLVGSQTLGDSFRTTEAYLVTGASFYSPSGLGAGEGAVLTIYALQEGVPGPIVHSESGVLAADAVGTAIDPTLDRNTLTLQSGFVLPAGDYALSIYGLANDVGWSTAVFDDNALFYGFGDDPDLEVGVYAGGGDLFLQVHGTPACGVSVPAVETVRLGTPPNPSAFLPGVTGKPVIGGVWDPVVDHASFFPSAFFDAIAISPFAANVPLAPYGTLLVDVATSAPAIFGSSPGAPFPIPIPDDCALVGATVATQALSTDGFVVALTNAIDVVVGTH